MSRGEVTFTSPKITAVLTVKREKHEENNNKSAIILCRLILKDPWLPAGNKF